MRHFSKTLLYSVPIFVMFIAAQISIFLSPLNCLDERPNSSMFLLIADPQIEGTHKTEKGWIDTMDLYLNDLSMSIVYKLAHYQYQPDFVIILGDLFSLQSTHPVEFEKRKNRYKKMFPIYNEHFYNLSGNHDIGYGLDMRKWMVKRYEEGFGKTNFIVTTTQFELIFINSMALDGTFEPSIANDTWRFIRGLPKKRKTRLVFSHIPLSPQNRTKCESDLYRIENDLFHFQNYLTRNTSVKLLNILNPDFVISGHNHDGCLSQIYSKPEYIVEEFEDREIRGRISNSTYALTVRSIMGLFDGGFALLSIKDNNFHYKECTTANFLTVRIFLVTDILVVAILGFITITLFYLHGGTRFQGSGFFAQ